MKQDHSVLQLLLLQYGNTLHKGTRRLSSDILHSQNLLSTDHSTQNPQGKPSPFSVSTCLRIWHICRLPALTMMPISSIGAGFSKMFRREKGKYVQIHQAVVREHKKFKGFVSKTSVLWPWVPDYDSSEERRNGGNHSPCIGQPRVSPENKRPITLKILIKNPK